MSHVTPPFAVTLPMHSGAGAAPAPAASAALLERLREMKRNAQRAEGESSSVRASWLEAVDVLLRVLRGWLQPATSQGLARINLASVHVADDEAGAYDAPALKITVPGPQVIWVRPVGTLCVGARGIVDIVCGSSRALLVLNRAGIWKIQSVARSASGSPRRPDGRPSSSLVPLDENEFARALTELIL